MYSMSIANNLLWVNAIKNPDRLIFPKEKIDAFNRDTETDIFSKDVHFSFDELHEQTERLLRKYFTGKKSGAEVVKKIVSEAKPCSEYALTVKRTSIRSLPTNRFVSYGEDTEIDRIQETGMETGEPVRVLLCGGKWIYARISWYEGWIMRNAIAFGEKSAVQNYASAKNFYVVTGNYVYTTPSPDKSISMKPFGMGAKIPFGGAKEIAGEMRTNQFVIKLPVRVRGKLAFRDALLPSSADVAKGYLPVTRRSIITEALKLVGEPYGWGDSFGARDCSSTIRSIYKTIGINLPRNASEQEKIELGRKVDFSGKGEAEKLRMLEEFQPGDLLFMKGHVMLYFGRVNNAHYIFHNFHREFSKGKMVSVNSALITPITIRFGKNRTALSEIRTGIIMESAD